MSENFSKKGSGVKTWVWHPNIFDLKIIGADSVQLWNCSPYVMFSSEKQDEEDPELVVNIEMKRGFEWDDENGWTWHKTWNIPPIKVTISLLDRQTMQEIECPLNVQLLVYATKLVSNSSNMIFFTEVPLNGQQVYDFESNDSVTLESVKFDTTSYNHDVKQF